MRLEPWRFAGAVALQALLLASVGVSRLDAVRSDTVVTLEAHPLDPYDPLAGYYVTLAYTVEDEAGAWLPEDFEGPVWLLLEPSDPGSDREARRVFRLARATTEPPALASRQARLRATVERGRVRIDQASRMYVPEARRAAIERALRAGSKPLVDLRVSDAGAAVVVGLSVAGEHLDPPADDARADRRER